jgi:hypothetical protein
LSGLLVTVFAYLWSYYLLGHYVSGDQVHYYRFYEAASDAGLVEAILLGAAMLSSGEPGSLSVLWFGAMLGVPKNIYVSVLNVIFVLGIFNLCRKNRCPWYAFLLLVFGYYSLVLMTGAERLKIGYIFIIWSLLFSGFLRYLFAAFSFLSHFQMLAFIVIAYVKFFSTECLNIFKTAKVGKLFLASAAVSVVVTIPVLAILAGKIYAKILAYYGNELKFIDIVNVLIIFLLAFLVFRRWDFRVWGILLFLPLVLILGGSRVNIMVVSFALYYFIIFQKMANPLVFLLLCYFLFKSYFFVSSILIHGHGFG